MALADKEFVYMCMHGTSIIANKYFIDITVYPMFSNMHIAIFKIVLKEEILLIL